MVAHSLPTWSPSQDQGRYNWGSRVVFIQADNSAVRAIISVRCNRDTNAAMIRRDVGHLLTCTMTGRLVSDKKVRMPTREKARVEAETTRRGSPTTRPCVVRRARRRCKRWPQLFCRHARIFGSFPLGNSPPRPRYLRYDRTTSMSSSAAWAPSVLGWAAGSIRCMRM